MRILKWLGVALGISVVLLGLLYILRTDPVFMISGKRLSGEELPAPADWSVCYDHMTIAVESRVDDPHSVTTLCFVHDGDLTIPAQDAGEKEWPAYVVADPRVRLKFGETVHPAHAERIMDIPWVAVLPSIEAKYPQAAARFDSNDPPEDVWMFRVSPR